MTTTGTIRTVSEILPGRDDYTAVLHFSDDVSYPLLKPEAMLDYATGILSAAGAAEFDAAIYHQFASKDDVGHESAVQLVLDMREARNKMTWKVGPVDVSANVSGKTFKPFLLCSLPSAQMSWQWTPAEARVHVQQVLDVYSEVEQDTLYYNMLITTVGVESARARAVVEDLFNYRVQE